jgi:hypothetical protein
MPQPPLHRTAGAAQGSPPPLGRPAPAAVGRRRRGLPGQHRPRQGRAPGRHPAGPKPLSCRAWTSESQRSCERPETFRIFPQRAAAPDHVRTCTFRSNCRTVATGVFRGRRGCAGRNDGWFGRLVDVLRCCTSPGEQVASLRDELLDGLRGSAGDFLDRGGHAVIPILAM